MSNYGRFIELMLNIHQSPDSREWLTSSNTETVVKI